MAVSIWKLESIMINVSVFARFALVDKVKPSMIGGEVMAVKGCDLDTSWLAVIDKMAVKRQLCHHTKDELDRDQIWHLATTC
uniref:Uncharacterized protein n=1 Tax=Salix viminalis TaxID=40686 RepID=A0A6N2MGC0_SALVM